ncbi:MAG: 6-pyruvoyl trahydropterin synthase family protein, partial [Candidatus Cryptobacteroides sp.]
AKLSNTFHSTMRISGRVPEVKRRVHGYLDHGNLNELLPFNPTAENIAKWVCDQVENCYRVEVQESFGNLAIYEID